MQNTDRLCMGCMNDNGGESVCPICGYDAKQKNDAEFLPVKTWIKNRYLVGKVIENDGEGVTYIGWDNTDNTIVNIREFFPVPLAERVNGSVAVKEGNDYLFNTALMDFLQLHKTLFGLDIAAVSPINEIIECNGSAYVISKAASGIVLREFLLRNGGNLSWEQARPLFMPLISAIIALHKNNIIHGGISPETILVGRDGKLRLTGFATAQLRKSGSSINSQLFPGYAAIEQYGNENGEELSESTDVYGFASTLFRVLMGTTLPEATERILDDKMSIPAEIAKALPNAVLVSLANALQILFGARTKTMDDFKNDIAAAADQTTGFVEAVVKSNEPKVSEEKTVQKKSKTKKQKSATRKYMLISAGITSGIFILISLVLVLALGNPFAKPKPEPEPSEDISSNVDNSSEESSSIPVYTEKLLTVPDFTSGDPTFEKVCSEYPDFKFAVLGKKYSSKAPGTVVAQDLKAGSETARDTVIYLTISLGQESLKVPELKGKTKDAATVELFKNGFLYHNITFYEIQDDSVDYGCAVKTDPAAGEYVNGDASITVYISNLKKQDVSRPSTPSYEEDNNSSQENQ